MSEVLEYRIGQLEQSVKELDVNMKEIYMEIGRLQEKSTTDARFARIEEKNSQQDRLLGSVMEGLKGVKEALQASSDKGVAEAAAGITINVDANTKIDGDVKGHVGEGNQGDING